MTEVKAHQRRTWRQKFRDAFRGVGLGIEGESSFAVHFTLAVLVVIAAAVLRATLVEWCVLILCIAVVLSAEMFNSALEAMAKAVDDQFNPQLGAALDIASGAVLMTAIGASIVGLVIFLYRAAIFVDWLPA